MTDHPSTVSNDDNDSESIESNTAGSTNLDNHSGTPPASSAPSNVLLNPSEPSLVTSEPSSGSNNPVTTSAAASAPSNGSNNPVTTSSAASAPSNGSNNPVTTSAAASAPSNGSNSPVLTSAAASAPSNGSNNPVTTSAAASAPPNGSGNHSQVQVPSSEPLAGPTSTKRTPAVAPTRPDDFNIDSWISSVSDPSYRFETRPPTFAFTSAPPSRPQNTSRAPAIPSSNSNSYSHPSQAPVLPIQPLNKFAPIAPSAKSNSTAPSTNPFSTTPSTSEASSRLMAFVDTSNNPATSTAPQSETDNTQTTFFRPGFPTTSRRKPPTPRKPSNPTPKDAPLRRPIETYKSVILLLEQNSCLHANGNKITCRACMSDFQFLSKKGTGNITSHLNSRRHLKKLENFQNYTTQGLELPPGPITKGNRFHLDLINLFCECDIPIEKVDDEVFVAFADKHLPFGALSSSAYRSTIANVINKLY